MQGHVELPEVSADAVTPGALRDAILHHGSLVVRQLLPAADVAWLIEHADAAFDECDAFLGSGTAGGGAFEPLQADDRYGLTRKRKLVRSCGALWAAEAPAVAERILARLRERGVVAAIDEFLGEPARLSVNKFTVRRVEPDTIMSWHQDGAFMGEGVRAVNVWIALTDCGGRFADTPALELVPARVGTLLDTGTPGAWMKDSIAPDRVDAAATGVGTARPEFAAGDALLFDEHLVHSTGTSPGMSRPRYAIECWFYASSAFPAEYALLPG